MGKFAKSFRDLDVYQTALDLVVVIHEFCKRFPKDELYVLSSQMRRASRSVCSNISEAWRKRRYEAAFVSKLSDAETEAGEMQSWLDVAMRLEYIGQSEFTDLDKRYEQVIGQLVAMIQDAPRWCRY